MTAQTAPSLTETGAWSFAPPAQYQTPLPAEELLHSANCGLIIHRVGQINYEFRADGHKFARILQQYTNQALHPYATTLLYREILGTEDRMHWLIHMRAPNDYGRLLEMVDHDTDFQQITKVDMLPERGGGNWERMFAQGSFRETVIVPQHGLTHADDDDEHLDGLFAAPAKYQTSQSPDLMLHSANAGAIIHRSGQVKYEFRKQGRYFAYEWQDYINRKLEGLASIFLYEEQWGTQDRIHWLMHLRSLDDYRLILELAEKDDEYKQIFAKERIRGGDWGALFLDGTLKERVLIPLAPDSRAS